MKKTAIGGAFGIIVLLAAAGGQIPPPPAGIVRTAFEQGSPSTLGAATDFGRLPVDFIPNAGQLDRRVEYYIQGKDRSIYFTTGGVTTSLSIPPRPTDEERIQTGRWTIRLDFVGADPEARPSGRKETGAVVSYFRREPDDWHAGLRTCSEIIYRDLWPGIDLVYSGTVSRLKYEFVVHPGADPADIRLAYSGVTGLSVDPAGRLLISTPAGLLEDDKPVAYQDIKGTRVEVHLAYRLKGSGRTEAQSEAVRIAAARNSGGGELFRVPCSYGFEVGEYDPSRPLILDPAYLILCGYLGGSSSEWPGGVAVDAAGNIYVTGRTASTEGSFPATVGPDLTYNGGTYDSDVFVAKVNPFGTSLLYCGYIGGANEEAANGIAVDGAGNAYVAGYTYSSQTTFPVTAGPDLTYNGGIYDYDAFIAKVNPAGTALVYCGYIGGDRDDNALGIAVDASGHAYLGGETSSREGTFPVITGPDLTFNGGSSSGPDAFVAKVNASGSALVYCGYIGGDDFDGGNAVAVDKAGSAYIAGYAHSNEATFPVRVGPDLTINGPASNMDRDAFIAKVEPAGTGLVYCGYIGGFDYDEGHGLAVDGSGCAYLTGKTFSAEDSFPVTVGPILTFNNGFKQSWDAFVAKVNSTGTGLVYCGYIGGYGSDSGNGIAVDAAGCAFVVGTAGNEPWPSTFPVYIGPGLRAAAGVYHPDQAYVAKINPHGTGFSYCGFLDAEGDARSSGQAIAVDSAGRAFLTGGAGEAETVFPVTVGPDLSYNGNGDVFIAKVYPFDTSIPKHAVGDFDGDGAAEAAVDFGLAGGWVWKNGAWALIAFSNLQSMISADADADGRDELIADFGTLGLWIWNWGLWNQLSARDPVRLAAGDVDDDGVNELAADFGLAGLWLNDGGAWTILSGIQPQFIGAADLDGSGGAEVIASFGTAGLWAWSGGAWTELSGANANSFTTGDTDGQGAKDIVADFGSLGLWLWSGGGWTQLSPAIVDQMIAADIDKDGVDEVIGDFDLLGLWCWDGGTWTELSEANAQNIMAADVNRDGEAAVAGDFGPAGLWLWQGGAWSQISESDSDGLLAGDFDGDGQSELMTDFGPLGLWLWNGGVWTAVNPLDADELKDLKGKGTGPANS